MKTNTKILATLGIVSGLGIAALPAMSYAADVSGDVKIETEITPAIAMRIHSNADVACTDAQDPSACIDTYGVIKYNPETAKSAGEPDSADGPSLATGLKLSANQKDLTTLYSNVEVRSNTGKFQLTLADNDTDTRLNLTPVSTETNQYIEAADGEPEAASASWAVQGGDISEWSAMPASDATPLTVLNNGTNSTSPLDFSTAVTINYGVSSGQTKTGTYSNVVTYTAIANTDNVSEGSSEDPGAANVKVFTVNRADDPNTITLTDHSRISISNTAATSTYYISGLSCEADQGYALECGLDNNGNVYVGPQSYISNSVQHWEEAAGQVTVTYSLIPDEIRNMTFPSEPTGTMQDFSCSSLPNDLSTTLLRDTRDNKSYRIAKIDSYCWMLDDVTIEGPRTLTSADSAVSSDFALPAVGDTSVDVKNRISIGSYGEHIYGANAANSVCPKGWSIDAPWPTSPISYDAKFMAPQFDFYGNYFANAHYGATYVNLPAYVYDVYNLDSPDALMFDLIEGDNPDRVSAQVRCVSH